MVTTEHLAWKLNIGLVKVNPMLRVTTQCGIDTAVHPIIRRYKTYHLDLFRKYISGRWYVDWMIATTNSIVQFKGVFVYSNVTFPKVYPKDSNKSIQAADILK